MAVLRLYRDKDIFMASDIVIIGGGISGTAAAWELAKNGVPVTLLERGDLASMASGWTLAGVRQSGRKEQELPLALAAVRRWKQLADELGTDVEYRQHGNLRLALIAEDIPAMKQVVETGNAHGIPMRWLDGIQAVHEVAPALTDELVGASFCPTDGHANPTKVVLAFAEAAKRAGATIRTGATVSRIVTDNGRVTGVEVDGEIIPTGTVIVAAGIYSPVLLAPLGIDLPIDIRVVPAIQTVPVEPLLDQVLGVPAGGFAGRQQADGRFRLTGTSVPWTATDHTDWNVQPTLAQLEHTLDWSVRLIPALKDVMAWKLWGGLVDNTPDALPVLERTPEVEGLVVAAGFSGHGFCLGPVTGEIVADLATEGETRHPIAPFARARFDTMTDREGVTLFG
jgi:sarcosine oxidase subunit beta